MNSFKEDIGLEKFELHSRVQRLTVVALNVQFL